MIQLTRRYRFSASHRLNSPQLTDAENDATYGKCNNPHGHGHNYIVEVTVGGPVDERTGRVADIPRLDRLIAKEIVERYDHRNLNTQVPELAGLVPTSEVVTAAIEQRLAERWPVNGELPALDRVRVWETRNNIFEVVKAKGS